MVMAEDASPAVADAQQSCRFPCGRRGENIQ